jgi:deoxyribonuclease-4
MLIGSHVHFGSDQLLGAAKEAISYGSNTFMLYTGAPQNTIRSSIDNKYTKEALKLMNNNNIDINNIICHAPYIINLANKEKIEAWNFSISFLKNEIKRCEELGIKYIVLHPGSSVKHTCEEGINNIIEALNYVINDNDKCMIILETMAGKGSECGKTIEEIKNIIEGVNTDNIGVCLDTCHLNDAGYDMNEFDNYLDIFDQEIGLSKVKCIHINDSKNVIGSHKDRHENIGLGTLGFTTILSIINNPKIKDVPKILETPYVKDGDNSYPPYKFEIEMLKNGKFNNNLIEDIINYYK